MQDLPGVSYVMPVLNEEHYIEAAIDSIIAQDYPGPTEIVLALGPSTDATNDIVARLQRAEPRIQAVDNPVADIPAGLNRAIRASQHPIIVRVDAHSGLPPDYTRRAVQTLLDTGAVNVGGVMMAVGRPGVQAAVARAYNSPLGLGGGVYHALDAEPGPAESAYLGVMRADALAEVGYFDETIRRGEDWELNFRFRAAGYLVWLDPSLRVRYWPRSSWRALWRQFWATGIWRGELTRRLRGRGGLRFFAPPLLVVATALTLVLGPLALAGVGGIATQAVAAAAAIGPASYFVLLVAVTVTGRGGLLERLVYPRVLAVMHAAWGIGFLVGLYRGAEETVDRSRAAPPSRVR
jgi:succinoglycan biosynthesis protein ExoA